MVIFSETSGLSLATVAIDPDAREQPSDSLSVPKCGSALNGSLVQHRTRHSSARPLVPRYMKAVIQFGYQERSPMTALDLSITVGAAGGFLNKHT